MKDNNKLKRFWLWLKWGSYTRIKRFQFDFSARKIFKTPPILITEDNIKIVTQLCHKDLLMYLLAIKSFYLFIQKGQVVVINDGSLTNRDICLLKQHVSGIQIIPINSIDNKICPQGGTWERFLYIADNVPNSYVFELDADTVTFADISEIKKAIENNISFLAGTASGLDFETTVSISDRMKDKNDDHIQTLVEKKIGLMNEYTNKFYIRGCGGYSGYGKGSFSRSTVEKFSSDMQRIFGKKWEQWGSEKVTTSFIIANSSSKMVLPFPKYTAYSPYCNKNVDHSKCSCIHFYGGYRFDNGFYLETAKKIINILR